MTPLAAGKRTRRAGFHPAFFDSLTQHVYPSRYADGRPAACHLWDGLPDAVVRERDAAGHVCRVAATLIEGFECNGVFYSRAQAATLLGSGQR